MNISKRRIHELVLTDNLTIVLWFGCFIDVQLTARLTVYTKELRIVYSGFKLFLENLLEKDASISKYVINL